MTDPAPTITTDWARRVDAINTLVPASGPPPTSAPPAPDEANAIREAMGKTPEGSPQYAALHQKLEAHYKARYPVASDRAPSAPAPRPATPAFSAPAPTISGIREELMRTNPDTRRYAELMASLEEAYKAQYGTGGTPPSSDPTIAENMARLRESKPDTAEWARLVDEIDQRVLQQPGRPEDVSQVQQAAEGIELPEGATWDVQELAKSCNVVRFNLGDAAVGRVVVGGMVAVQRALHDASAGNVYEAWEDAAPDLEAEWGSEGEHRVQDIREALYKLSPKTYQALVKERVSKTGTRYKVVYHPAVLRFLADFGRQIPLMPDMA